jgi:hypothetical protein
VKLEASVLQKLKLFYVVVKMFEEISGQDLVVGKKYKIKKVPFADVYYTGIFVRRVNTIQVFDKVTFHSKHKTKIITFLNNVYMCKYYYAYISKKEQIQQDMEKRALDKILKRLINEEFSW